MQNLKNLSWTNKMLKKEEKMEGTTTNEVYRQKLREIDVHSVEYTLKSLLKKEGFVLSSHDNTIESLRTDETYRFYMPPFGIKIDIDFDQQIRCCIEYLKNAEEEEYPSLDSFRKMYYETSIFLHDEPENQLRRFLSECKEIIRNTKYLDINYWKEAVQEFFDL